MDIELKKRLIKLSNLILENTKSERSFFKRVNGLHQLHRSYIEFYKKSKFHHEDHILESFAEEVNQKLIPLPKSEESESIYSQFAFTTFLENYCMNFVQLDVTPSEDNKWGALSLDDLWDGLLAYGRFRWKTYLTASKSYAKDQKIKSGKLLKLSEMLSPAEPLGIKGYAKVGSSRDTKIKNELFKHRDYFDNFVYAYFRGYQSHAFILSKKTSEVSKHKGLSKKLDKDPNHFQPSIDNNGDSPIFHGISLPHYSRWQMAYEKKDEDGQTKWFKAIVGEKLLSKKIA